MNNHLSPQLVITTYDVENPGSGLGQAQRCNVENPGFVLRQAQRCSRVKSFNGIPTLLS
jgi:hypothetical protein